MRCYESSSLPCLGTANKAVNQSNHSVHHGSRGRGSSSLRADGVNEDGDSSGDL